MRPVLMEKTGKLPSEGGLSERRRSWQEVVLIMVTAGAGMLDLLLEEAMLSLGGLIRA